MKCHKPGTDQSLELVLFANGRPCAEYELPTAATSDPSVVRSFLPVEDGQELTVRGTFSGSCLYGSFDLIADGSFLADKRIEAPKDGKIRHYMDRKVDFRSVFDAPKMKGHTSVFPPDRVVEGNLHVKTLGERSETAAAFPSPNEFGIGSLVILVSLNQRTDDNHTSKYKSLTCGDPDIGRKDDDDGGIPPSYELMVRVLEGEVSKARQAKHKRHSEQTRFGPKPWAKLIFHYRSKASLQQFGCVERNGDSQGLEPSNPATFVRSSIEGARPKTRNGSPETSSAEHNRIFNTPPPDQILQAQYDRTDRAEVTPHRRPREAQRAQLHRSSSIPREYSRHRPQTNASPSASSMSSAKGKLMGQSLNLPVDFISPRLTNHASKEHLQSYTFGAAMHDDHHEWEMQERAQGEQEEKLEEEQRLPGQTPSFDEFNQEVASDMSAQERADAMEDAQASATPSRGLHSAPVAQMFAPIDPDRWKDSTERTINEADGKEQAVEVKEEEQMEEASPRFLHLPAETWSFLPLSEHIAESNTEDHFARVSRTMSPAKIPQTVTLQSMHMQLSSSASEAVGRSTSRGGDSYDGLRERATTGLALDDRQTYFDGEGRLSQRYPGERSLESVEQVGRPEDKAPHSAAIQSSQSGSPSRPQPHVAAFSAGCNIEASPFVPASIASLSKPTFREDSLTPTSPSTKRADTSTKDDASPAPNYKIEISKKRSASISAASRESTPASKKPRFLELAVRKTELKRQIEEKQKRKAAAQKLLEERQKLRKEEERLTQEAVERQKLHDEEERMREETEELEVATLERMVLEEDEETEILEGLAMAEETLLSEAKAGRKRAEEALQANEEG